METVESQKKLRLTRAVQIAVQGIRIRIGRSLVTLTSVALGIAFLMSTVTAQLIRRGIQRERVLRQNVQVMMALVRAETGDLSTKILGVVLCGACDELERRFLETLAASQPAGLRGVGGVHPALRPSSPETVGDGAAMLIVLGRDGAAPVSLSVCVRGLLQPTVLDTLPDRVYPDGIPFGVRREPFFGPQMAEQEARRARQEQQDRARTGWIVSLSLAVTVIGVSNAFLMSVTERFREIGTMKCLGALSTFIRSLFLIESALVGLAGSLLGVAGGALLAWVAYSLTYGWAVVFGSLAWGRVSTWAGGTVLLGTTLSMAAALYPARFAARMVPAAALRSTV